MLLALALLACTSGKEDDSATTAAPSITWLAPTDGATVTAGLVECSLVIDGFSLQDPSKHNDEGAPSGYVSLSDNDALALSTGETTFSITLSAGAHTLLAQLYYADGDEVSATTTQLCDEDDTDTTCAPVTASISVTAE